MAGAKDSGYDDDHRTGDQSDGCGCGPGKRGNDEISASPAQISCSICLELVVDDGTRSKAKLKCGHQFHLDCIGSAFNMKGAMQCPNCRNVEKGQWLYAIGSTRPFPDFSMEDWILEEDLYGLTYQGEMQYGVHWCPFGELAQAGSFEELEPASTTYHNEFHGHHAAAMNRSYLAYVGQGPAATPRTSENNNTDDHSWNSLSNDHFHQLAVAPQNYHHSPFFSLPGAFVVDGEIDSSLARGISYAHPFLFGHRSNQRTSPAINSHQGSSNQMHEHLHTQHRVFNHPRQHHASGPTLASPFISVTRRGLPPPPPMPDQNVGFVVYPQPIPSGGHRERETDQFHAWERDWFPHFPIPLSHRTISSIWPRHY